MINIEDIEKKFIMEHSVAGQIKVEENKEEKSSDKYEEEKYAEPEFEEATEEFEKFSIPLFDKNAWDDSALIRAWDESIRQRDANTKSNKQGHESIAFKAICSIRKKLNFKVGVKINAPEGPTSNEAPVCKVKVSRVQVDESFDEVRAPTYDRFQKPQIGSKRSRASTSLKNKPKKPRNEDHNEEHPEQNHNAWEASAQPSTTNAADSQPQAMPFVPPSSMLPSQDDDLNNLVNAWYFAGYYSAIYQMKNKEKQ
ncbi:hypothetical protein DSO57_1016740 [Entomophthora muscae]|uniref:Uncharacterized protein n=1 Tax=Entomophthora muscae TaxID=34485 RepID=A0ACC2TSA6_9FUNG|nr:hypothetical protein DSO57_1016740 [Entomophthora muscae]